MSVSLLSNDSQLTEAKVRALSPPLSDFTRDHKPESTGDVKLYWSALCLNDELNIETEAGCIDDIPK